MGLNLKALRSGLVAGLMSVPVLTLTILLLIDFALRQTNPVDALGFRTVDVWNLPPRMKICRETSPDVAIIGSSLLLTLNLLEKETHTFYRLSPPYFQQQLRKATQQAITCINMCTGSQVVSESYLIAQAMTNQPNYPRVLIYGLSLRDFMHDQFARETSTDTFASIAPWVPASPEVLAVLTNDNARREFLLDHFWYLYRDRLDFKNIFTAYTKDFLELLPLDVSFMRVSPERWFVPQRTGWLWETWVPRKHLASVFSAHPEFLHNFYTEMHATVYRTGSETTRLVQNHYFEALADLCNRKGIRLVVVNMPLSERIMQLAPPGLNEAFSGYLAAFCEKNKCDLIDLYGDKAFPSDLFSDGAHLNYEGSVVMADRIISELKQRYPDALAAMTAHAQQRAKNPSERVKDEEPYNREIMLTQLWYKSHVISQKSGPSVRFGEEQLR